MCVLDYAFALSTCKLYESRVICCLVAVHTRRLEKRNLIFPRSLLYCLMKAKLLANVILQTPMHTFNDFHILYSTKNNSNW